METKMSITKDLKYLAMASHFGKTFSKDRSTQVGAFFMHPTEYTLLATGYNGLPRGCDDEKPERHERPLKYEFFEHAECNAIYNCVREIFRGCTLRVSEQMHANDIRAVISVGTAIVYVTQHIESDSGRALLEEAGVSVVLISPSELPGRQASEVESYSSPPCGTALQGCFPHCHVRKKRATARISHRIFVPADDSNENRKTLSLSFVHPGADEALSRVILPADGEPETGISAVRQAIFNIARTILEGSVAAVAPLPPCRDCAQAIHAVGSNRVVTYEPTPDQNERWGSSFGATRALFAAHGIHMHEAPQI